MYLKNVFFKKKEGKNMEAKKFGITEAISYGTRTFIDHFMVLFGSIIIAGGIYYLVKIAWLMILATFYFSAHSTTIIDAFAWGRIDFTTITLVPPIFYVIYFIGSLFILLIYYGFLAGFIQLLFKIHDKGTGTVSDIFSRFDLAPRMWVTGLLYGLIVCGGLILLIIPGIYFAMRFALYPFFIVDKNEGIIDSLRHSYHVTLHHVLRLFGVFLILFLFNLIPLIGPALSGFIAPIVFVYIYRKLIAQPPALAHA